MIHRGYPIDFWARTRGARHPVSFKLAHLLRWSHATGVVSFYAMLSRTVDPTARVKAQYSVPFAFAQVRQGGGPAVFQPS